MLNARGLACAVLAVQLGDPTAWDTRARGNTVLVHLPPDGVVHDDAARGDVRCRFLQKIDVQRHNGVVRFQRGLQCRSRTGKGTDTFADGLRFRRRLLRCGNGPILCCFPGRVPSAQGPGRLRPNPPWPEANRGIQANPSRRCRHPNHQGFWLGK